MIKHIIDTVGVIFSRIDPIRSIPKQLADQLYIDYSESTIDANVLTTSSIFDITLILLYEDIADYGTNHTFVTETFKTLPSGTDNGDLTRYSKMNKYILIPDIIKLSDTSLKVVSNITYNIVEEFVKGIGYSLDRSSDMINTLPLMLTTHILCEYGIATSPASVLRELTELENGSERLIDLSNIVEENMINILNSTTDILDGDKIKIKRDKSCEIIIL